MTLAHVQTTIATPPGGSRPFHRSLPLLLAFMTALGPFSVDAYLPSFPEIEKGLQASPFEVQQTLSIFLASFAFMTLWHGAISDALGRRRVTLVCLGLFALSSVGCAWSRTVGALWVFRGLQGVTSGAGIVLGRAVVRDLLQGPEAQRMMSRITMMFALAPALAPIVGGWLDKWFGWQSLFYFLVLMAGVQWLWCWWALPETLPPEKRHPLHPMFLLRSYYSALTEPAFLAVTGVISLNFAGFFLYVVSSPKFLIDHLHIPQTGFYWLFVPAMAGMMIGAWLSGRLAGKITPMRTIAIGSLVMAAAALCNVVINLLLPPGLPWSVAPIFPYVLGMSLTMPSLTLLGLERFRGQWGLGSSCQVFIQTGVNSLNAAFLAPLLWVSPLHLALGQLGLLAAGFGCLAVYRWRTRAAALA